MPPVPLNWDEQSRFLRELAHTGSVALACAAAGVDLATARASRDLDGRFELAWRAAAAEARAAHRRRIGARS